MSIRKHYKMFKKGKNWCYMALAIVSVVFGTTMIAQNASADSTDTSQAVISAAISNDGQKSLSNSQELVANNQNDTKSSSVSEQEEQTVSQPVKPKATEVQNGWQTTNGNSYYYKNGQKLTGQQNIEGKDYYFNDQGQQQKDYFLNQNNHTYYFQADGTRLNDGFYNNWGHTYYFQKDGVRLDDGFYNTWGHTYYFGNGGVRLDDGFYNNWGHTYYFGDGGVRLDDGFYNNWGHTYYFGNGGVRLDNSFYNNWGNTYYFTGDGSLAQNKNIWVNGSQYNANNAGILSPISLRWNGVNSYILRNGIGHANISYQNAIPAVTGTYSGTDNGKPNMVVVHETANPKDSIWGEINFERAHYDNAFVHAFVDANNIIQISTTDHEAWGAAYPANGRAVQFEQVEVYGGWNFARELVNAAYYTAYNMRKYGLTPSLAQSNGTGTLWSHHNVTQYLGGTDHTDPDGYWSNRARNYFGTGYNMNDFLQLVNYEYAKLG
ncbi:N-acetylmuramoyl-L-alanine amidase [Limosilactobacillus caccae]|uniref:N-acetylmuramoyl-L-alanine amidase n=1 Tax=Limosilactobacillus caccae TaxID=1926284 RepID=UPI0009F86326|nr:N-acetylmuramoyl-L-alanine amidase [Limosilactobacillus caccae]